MHLHVKETNFVAVQFQKGVDSNKTEFTFRGANSAISKKTPAMKGKNIL